MSADSITNGAVDLVIDGMTCSGCVKAVSRALFQVAGVTGVAVDLATGHAHVEGRARRPELNAAVERAGFAARPASAANQE